MRTSPDLTEHCKLDAQSERRPRAGGIDKKAADLKRELLVEEGFSGVEECPIRALQLGPAGQFGCSGNVSNGTATYDDGRTVFPG